MTMRTALLITFALVSLSAPSLGAQQLVQAGRGSVSTAVRVGLTIPTRLKFRVAAQPRLVEQKGDTATYSMDVEVAANLAWTLNVLAGDANADARSVRVRDEHGDWRAIASADRMVTLTADEQPSNWRPVRVELQVIGARGPASLPGLTFDLQPSQR